MEGVHEESFLTQTPSKISRRYSPMTKSEYSGYRPPDPVFLSYNNTQTTNTFLPLPLSKHKNVEDIDKVQVNNKFTVNKLSSVSREAGIAPEALELINILNPVEAREIQNITNTQETISEKYTSLTIPIEVKKVETKVNTVVQKTSSIIVGKPKTLSTYNQVNNNLQNTNQTTNVSQDNKLETNIVKNEINNIETAGPIFNNINNQISSTSSSIEIKKPIITPKISQYTNAIDFNSFVSSNFAEIIDQKTEQKILSKNNINVRKLVTDINLFLNQNKKEFKNSVSSYVNQFFSTYSDENLTTLQNLISNTINNSNNIENLNTSVYRVLNEYFSKNKNEFNQSIVSEFEDSFNTNLQTQLTNLQNKSITELSIVQNIDNAILDVKNIYESKQVEIENIISEVNNENVLSKVVELANTYQSYQSLTTQSISNISSQINQTNITQIKEAFNQQVSNFNIKSESALSNFKQEIYGFLYTYISSSVEQETLNNIINSVTNSKSVDQVNSIINEFVSSIKTEDNTQIVNSLQYFSNDKYSNIVSGLLIEAVENNVLKSLYSVVQNYSNQDNIQNSLVNQVKNDLVESFTSDIKNTVNKFGLTELKTSIENVYKSQDINDFKSEFSNVLNKSGNSSNYQIISYFNNLLETNISQFTTKSANVLNETRYANSVKNLVNENLHNVVSNIVHNLSEVSTYSDNKNISTLLNNIKIINEKLLINNAENRLQNFNLIQTSIENFLNNTENKFVSILNNVKTNQNSYSPEIIENLSSFNLLSTNVTSDQLTEVKNLIVELNTQSFNEESKQFIQETKTYTDLINMKNQITSELDNFVSNTFETILEVNQNSTLISTQQMVNLVEEAVSSFNVSNVSNKAVSYIQNVLQDVKKPELYNNTFQLITSTNILEEQVKSYLLQNNSLLADFSLQQIINTINQPIYSDYVTFQDIKEIINKSTNTSSFGILSEVKQYINQANSQENIQFISNLKTYLAENQTNDISVKNVNFTDELKYFISEQNSYSPETFNQVINSVTNKFENKSALILNEIINENVSKLNQVLDTLYSSVTNNQSKESILNTLSTFINNSVNYGTSDNNFSTEQNNQITHDSQKTYIMSSLTIDKIEEFKNIINNAESLDVINNFSNEIIKNTFNESTNKISLLVETLNISDILKQEIVNQINTSSNLIEANNAINQNKNLFSIAETNIFDSILNENMFVSNLINSVNKTFKSEILNNKNNVESYVNIAMVEYLQNKFTSYQSSPFYKSETYLESLTKFIETNISNSSVVMNTVKKVAEYATGDQVSINNLIKIVDNLYQSGTLNNIENNQLTYKTFEKNNIEFLSTINNTFSEYNVNEVLTSLNSLTNEIVSSAQTSIENITKSTSSSLDVSSVNIQNLEDVKYLINYINEHQNNNNVSTNEEIVLNSLKTYVANEYVKINMLQNIINQTTEIKSVYDYNTQSTNELNVSQEEKTSIIQKQNQEFLNQYTQQFISENLSSSIFVANVTKTLASNFTISKLSTQAVEVVNNINSLSTSSEINNYATKVEENSFNEAKSILTTILNDLGKTEISQMIINSASSSEIKNVIHNNFNNLNTLEKNIAEKTLNESFYVSNRLNEAINIFNQDIKENSTNISSYVATQTLTNLIQNYVNSQINSGSLSVVDNIPKANINQAITLANALSVINKEDIINNLLSLNQNTFNNKQESSYRVVSFKFDQDFREAVSSIAASSSPETIATDVSIFKQEIFNSAISTVNEIMNQSNIKLDSYDTIVQNQTISVDEKIQDILKTFNTTLSNQSLFEENKNLENIKNYVLNESYKIELLNKISSQDLLVNNKFDEFENEITTKIQQYLISSSFVKNVNNFRTEISQKNSIEEVKQYSSEQKIIILNDVKSFVSDFISVVKPEYLNTENLNTINDATSIEQISNIFAENKNQFTSSENSTVSNIINQSSIYSQIVNSVANSILNDNNFTQNTMLQKVDSAVYNVVQNQFKIISNTLINNIISDFDQSYESTRTLKENVERASTFVNNYMSVLDTYFNETLNSFKINNMQDRINSYNQDVIRTVNTAVQNYDVSKLLTNTINENISMNQSILNSDVIENINHILQENNISSSERVNSKDMINNVLSNQIVSQQIQNTINSNTVRNLFNRSYINELIRNTSTLRTLLLEKTQGSETNLNTAYLNKIYSTVNNAKTSLVNETNNEIEKIENITLNFQNQNNYQRSSIQVYDEITNRTEASLHPDYNTVNLNESENVINNTANNNFRNISVVKQIDENNDVKISNLRIEKVWNKFVQEEVSKIVEEVHNSSEFNNQENIFNEQKTSESQNSRTENFNKSEYNLQSGNVNNTENLSVYNSFNNQQPGTSTTVQETEEKVNYREITELVFTRIEEKLKTFSVTEEDIIILKHKILSEVTEIYENRSRLDIKKSEEKMKKEVEDLFIKFLNS
jgi:hypothetical protein